MSELFAKLFRWLIFLAVCAGLVFLAWHFYGNRQLIFRYVGDQNRFFAQKTQQNAIRIGIGDRAAALSVYAPLSLHGSGKGQNFQAQRFSDNEAMWAALENGSLDFVLVSLDQAAKRAPLSSLLIAFPYAVSEGSDGIVCSSSWDRIKNGQTRRVACVTNTTGEYLAQLLADAYMDSPTPVQIVGAYNIKEAEDLLRSGQVEALAANQPHLGRLKADGYRKLSDWQAPGIIEVCALKKPQSEQKNQALQKAAAQLAKIWFNRLDNLNLSPGPTYSSIAKASGLQRDEVRDTLRSGLHFCSAAEAQDALQSGHLANETLKLIEYWMMSGTYATTTVKALPDPDKLLFNCPELLQLNSGSLTSPRSSALSPEAKQLPSSPADIESPAKAEPPIEARSPEQQETASNDSADPVPAEQGDSTHQSAEEANAAESAAETTEAHVPDESQAPDKNLSPFTVPRGEALNSESSEKTLPNNQLRRAKNQRRQNAGSKPNPQHNGQ